MNPSHEYIGRHAPDMGRLLQAGARPMSDTTLFGYKSTVRHDQQFVIADVEFHRPGDVVQLISRKIADTEDENVRAALIKMGWTPPPPPID